MKVGLLTPVIGSRNSGDALIESAIRRIVPANEFRRFGIRTRLGESEMDSLNECDVALLCGSNLYQSKSQTALTKGALDRLKIPLVPLGVGTSAEPGALPEVDGEQADLIRALHARSAASSVRDPATQRFLEGLGVESVQLTGCPVFFHGLVKPQFEFGDGPPTISLRQTFLHGAEPLEFRQEALLEALCQTHRPQLVCQGPSDLPQARRLARRFGLEVLHDDEWQADIQEWLAKRQAWTGGFRLHHGMLALSHGRPAWFVSHDSRVDEFAKMVGLEAPDVRSVNPMALEHWGREKTLLDFDGVAERWDGLAKEMEGVLRMNGLPSAIGEKRPEKPRVLFLVPRRDWAYDFSAKSIQKRVDSRITVRIRYSTDNPSLRPEPYDLAVVNFWADKAHLGCGFDPNRIVKIVSSHRWEHSGKHGPLSPGEFASKHLSDAGTVWTTSQRLKWLIDRVHPRVSHCPNGFESERFQPLTERRGRLRIGAAGWSGDSVKGYSEVLFPAVGGMDFKLADGSFPHGDMNAFYNEIDVLAVTSAHEGEPLTLIESMAAGCFPVCSDVGIVRELIRHGENGLIVEERSVAAFRAAFEWCESHLDEVRRAGRRNAQEILKTRSWELLAPEFEAKLRDAMVYADRPWFLVEETASATDHARQRLQRLLVRFRQTWAYPGDVIVDEPVMDLADDISASLAEGRPWRLKPGVRYRLSLDADGPVGLEWESLEAALGEALLPRPESRFPRVARWVRALRRRLSGSQFADDL